MKSKIKAVLNPGFSSPLWDDPHHLIPATSAAYDAMVEAMAKDLWESKLALHQFGLWEDTPERHRDRAKGMVRDGFAAIGIKKPTKGNE